MYKPSHWVNFLITFLTQRFFFLVLWQIQALTVCGLRAYRDLQLLRTKNME